MSDKANMTTNLDKIGDEMSVKNGKPQRNYELVMIRQQQILRTRRKEVYGF